MGLCLLQIAFAKCAFARLKLYGVIIYIYICILEEDITKRQNSLLLRVSCSRTHQTVFNGHIYIYTDGNCSLKKNHLGWPLLPVKGF